MRWVSILYFAEGFPYGVFRDVWSVYFRTAGVSLKEIGLMDLLGLPWAIKPLWAPLVDRYGDRRHWIASCLAVMGILLAIHPLFDAASLSAAFWLVLLFFTLASATQDIAIDAHTIAFLPKEEVGAANGIRVRGYSPQRAERGFLRPAARPLASLGLPPGRHRRRPGRAAHY